MSYAIVTGASGGIGLCICHELAAKGYNLLMVARSGDKLQQECNGFASQYGIKASFIALDLSHPKATESIIQWVDQNKVTVSVLVNNAGYGLWGAVETVALSDLNNMMTLNMSTLVELTHKMIPYLKQAKPSYIMQVASTAAYQSVPTLSTYAATKAFVLLFSRGLRYELKNSGISVTCLCPGATSTGFIDRAGLMKLKERAEKFSMKPDAVAQIGVRGMFAGKAEIVPGIMNKLTVHLTYWLPKALIEKIAAGLYE